MKSIFSFAILAFALSANAAPMFPISKITYRVPVTDPRLLPFASIACEPHAPGYFISDKEIRFELPQELTGSEKKFALVRGENHRWIGDGAAADCLEEDKKITCRLKFRDLDIDMDEVKTFLREKYSDGEELRARIALAFQFSGEAIGELTIETDSSLH